MSISEVIDILRRSWLLLVVGVVVGVGGALAYVVMTPARYQSESVVFVGSDVGTNMTEVQQAASFTKFRVPTYVDLVSTEAVMNPVIERLGLGTTAGELAKSVNAKSATDTNLITITVQNADSATAADIANDLADSLATAVHELETIDAGQFTPVRLTTQSVAAPAAAPTNDHTRLSLVVGGLIGLVMAAAAAITASVLGTRVRSRRDIEQSVGVPVLGRVSEKSALAFERGGTRAAAAQTRELSELATHLRLAEVNPPLGLTVTSLDDRTDTTAVSIGVARALARSGSQVVVVEADLRRSSVASQLALAHAPGLLDVLSGSARIDDVLRASGEQGFSVLPLGTATPDSRRMLQGEQMSQLVAQLQTRFDAVVVDCAPLAAAQDASVLGRVTGGLLLAVDTSGSTRRDILRASVDTLDSSAVRVAGAVETVPGRGQRRPSTGA